VYVKCPDHEKGTIATRELHSHLPLDQKIPFGKRSAKK
jgi:hypothetical protein